MRSIDRFFWKGKEFFYVSGMDYGTALQILQETDKHVLAHKKGHRGWCGRGQTHYYGPELMIFEKEGDGIVSDNFTVKEWEYTRETRKKVHKEATEFFGRLEE